ncbi:hypothetical protein EFK50_13035 [Nocardioides marmoriginsengisoli]|uniref:Uncharacterized protein n=1 Tax=Nocardioides marmoriginsengisoli TaxID=661483 RepID=A0A3N0CGU1_9ACTN|nr:hypothetical protein EFK50_13035 [Nocardioides marmoriginsengisoli]
MLVSKASSAASASEYAARSSAVYDARYGGTACVGDAAMDSDGFAELLGVAAPVLSAHEAQDATTIAVASRIRTVDIQGSSE